MPLIPVPVPLEPLIKPVDGTVASSMNFGTPVYDWATSLTGRAAGDPDSNSGHPIVARTHQGGMLAYSNVYGITTNPGALNFNAYSSTSSVSTTVPFGQQLVVAMFSTDSTGAAVNQYITVNDGATTSSFFACQQSNVNAWMPFPLILDQNWILSIPAHMSAVGYYVLRDTAVSPVCKTVNNIATSSVGSLHYTVPVGSTLWIYGCGIAVNSPGGTFGSTTPVYASASLLNGNTQIIAVTKEMITTGANTYTNSIGIDLGSGVSMGAPTSVSSGSVVEGSAGTNANLNPGVVFWGVLL